MTGWPGAPAVPLDGRDWPLDVAAEVLEFPESLLRELVRFLELAPSGTANMRPFRSQGRTARVYPARSLIMITDAVTDLREVIEAEGKTAERLTQLTAGATIG